MQSFPWRPRMRGVVPSGRAFTVLVVHECGDLGVAFEPYTSAEAPRQDIPLLRWVSAADAAPDQTDDATLGALLGAVREAYAEPFLVMHCSWADRWAVIDRYSDPDCADRFDTELDALLGAWSARPKARIADRLWWVSWYQPGDDFQSLAWPPPPAILAYWCSGYSETDAMVVALVRAPSPEAARAEVTAAEAWPDAGAQRFCEPREKPPGGRFPRPTQPEMWNRWPAEWCSGPKATK